MRNHSFVVGEFYHVYIHGVSDFKIFKHVSDYNRFVSLIFCANGTKPIPRLERMSNVPSLAWDIEHNKVDIGNALVNIVCFTFMPTHIHFLLQEKRNKGISVYMHKLLTSYAKYFNLKHDRRGHLFERSFQSRHIDDNRYLLYVSRYIHRNPDKIIGFSGNNYINYPWSSCQDFIKKNRWGKLLCMKPINSQFKNVEEYLNYIDEPDHKEFTVLPLV